MRLIDADKLREVYDFNRRGSKKYSDVYADCIFTLDRADTIEAIPIKWIEDYCMKHNLSLQSPVETMLKRWREENE